MQEHDLQDTQCQKSDVTTRGWCGLRYKLIRINRVAQAIKRFLSYFQNLQNFCLDGKHLQETVRTGEEDMTVMN